MVATLDLWSFRIKVEAVCFTDLTVTCKIGLELTSKTSGQMKCILMTTPSVCNPVHNLLVPLHQLAGSKGSRRGWNYSTHSVSILFKVRDGQWSQVFLFVATLKLEVVVVLLFFSINYGQVDIWCRNLPTLCARACFGVRCMLDACMVEHMLHVWW